MRKMLEDMFSMFDQLPDGSGIDMQGHGVKHAIDTPVEQQMIAEGMRKYSQAQAEFIDQKTEELYKRNIIKKGYGAWRAFVHLAKKKDGTWRYCVDYRKLNA